jgi:RNA polymerase sigma-B factor
MTFQERLADASDTDAEDMEGLLAHYGATRDGEARDRLILYHQRLARYIAARFVGQGETQEDLVQVATLGLIHALDRYDHTHRVKFSTYAMPTIVGEIKRHLRDKTWHVKVPRWLLEMSLSARRADKVLALRLGRAPTVKEIAAEIGASEDTALEALEVGRIAQAASLDTPLERHEEGGATLMDLIGGVDQALHDLDAFADLQHALSRLEPRERQVIRLRFFGELSQRQIAQRIGLSQMQVSRLERRAMEKLRAILAASHL